MSAVDETLSERVRREIREAVANGRPGEFFEIDTGGGTTITIGSLGASPPAPFCDCEPREALERVEAACMFLCGWLDEAGEPGAWAACTVASAAREVIEFLETGPWT